MTKGRLAAVCVFASLIGGVVGNQLMAVDVQSCPLVNYTKTIPLTKVGLQHIRVVRQLEVGVKPGDVIFQFPHGKMILEKDPNGMLKMPRRENIIPNGVNNALVFQEAKILEFKEREKGCP